jgi:hypothetical protein
VEGIVVLTLELGWTLQEGAEEGETMVDGLVVLALLFFLFFFFLFFPFFFFLRFLVPGPFSLRFLLPFSLLLPHITPAFESPAFESPASESLGRKMLRLS